MGFDPLGYANNREILFEYREAEIKHARLAMLVSRKSTSIHVEGVNSFRTLFLTFYLNVVSLNRKGSSWLATVGNL